MPYDDLLDRLARLDLYPSDRPLPTGWLGDDLDPHIEGSMIVSTLQEKTPPGPATQRRNWRLVAAAVAVIVVAIAAVTLLRGPSSEVIEDPPTATTVIPTSTIAAPSTSTTATTLDLATQRATIAGEIAAAMYTDPDALAALVEGAAGAAELVRVARNTVGSVTEILEHRGCEEIVGDRVRCTIVDDDIITREFDTSTTSLVTIGFEGLEVIDVSYAPEAGGPRQPMALLSWLVEADANPPECTGLVENQIADDPAACWAWVASKIPEFKDSDAYIP